MRVFVTSILPSEIIIKYGISQAGNLFSRKFCRCIEFDKIISYLPLKIDERISNDFIVDGLKNCDFVQFRFFKNNRVGKYLNRICENISMAHTCRNANEIWFYNITVNVIVTYILLKFIYRKKVFLLMADFIPSNKKISFSSLLHYLGEKADGILSLSMRSCFNSRNFECIPGIVDANDICNLVKPIKKKPIFLFSGTLSEMIGLNLVLDVFSKLPDFELYITGIGGDDVITPYVRKYPNIHHWGYVTYDKYLKLLDEADFCLSFRNPSFDENLNNFPSKILEFFSHNKIVVSTMEYPEIEGFKYITTSYNSDEIKRSLIDVVLFSNNEKLIYQDNREMLISKLGVSIWRDMILKIEKNA